MIQSFKFYGESPACAAFDYCTCSFYFQYEFIFSKRRSLCEVQCVRNNIEMSSVNLGISDDDLFDGIGRAEMSLDEAEDGNGESDHVTSGVDGGRCNEESGTEMTSPQASDDVRQSNCCARHCLHGCTACLRRFSHEVGSACDDLRHHVTDWRRRHPCSKNSWMTWIRKKFPVVGWLPKYT